jgi:hypothetical protein
MAKTIGSARVRSTFHVLGWLHRYRGGISRHLRDRYMVVLGYYQLPCMCAPSDSNRDPAESASGVRWYSQTFKTSRR